MVNYTKQLKNKPYTDASEHSWVRVNGTTASGDLSSPGSKTITLTPVPKGVNGTNTYHYVRIYNGTGTAETCLITGGTAVAGAATGTIIVTTANSHTGAWWVGSATAGIQEAIKTAEASSGTRGGVHIGAGDHNLYAPTTITRNGITIQGVGQSSTVLHVQTPDMVAFRINPARTAEFGGTTIRNLTVYDAATTIAGSGSLIEINVALRTVLSRVTLTGGTKSIHLNGGNGPLWISDSQIDDPKVGMLLADGAYNSGIVITTTQFGATTQPDYGFRLRNGGGVWITNTDFYRCGTAFLIDPGDNSVVTDIFVTSTSFDSGDGVGVWIVPASMTGTAKSLFFSNAWSATNVKGMVVDATLGAVATLSWTGGVIFNNEQSGAEFIGNVKGVKITGGTEIGANSIAAAGTHPGLSFAAGVEQVIVQGNRFGTPTAGVASAQSAGLVWDGDNYVIIKDNIFSGDTVGISGAPDDETDVAVIEDNIGVDTVYPVVASALEIAAPINPTINISGTTTILAITGGWEGRLLTLIKTDSGSVTVGGIGGNIPAARTLPESGMITLKFVGGTWY